MTEKEILALVDGFDWAAWNASLQPEFADIFENVVASQAGRQSRDPFTRDDPFVQKRLTTYVGDRIVSLDETTRTDVAGIVRDMLSRDDGLDLSRLADDIADRVREKFDGYEHWRADSIARNESVIAVNYGTVLGLRQDGATHVRVLDSDDSDAACAEANGQIWTLEEALARPIEHPGCERDFEPVVDE